MSGINPPRILVTRPRPQGEETAEKLRVMGYDPILAPMLRVEPITPPELPDFAAIQAALITSRNGVERLAALTSLRDFVIMTVGDRTADAAKAAGFQTVRSASGDGSALLKDVRETLTPDGGPILHIRGQHTAIEFNTLSAEGYNFQEIIAYEAVDQPALPGDALSPSPAAALVYSQRTALALAEAMRRAHFDPTPLVFIGISANAGGRQRAA